MEIKFYEVRSGRPNGETYDRDVAWAKTKTLAEQCADEMWADVEEWEKDSWVYGPHVLERSGDPSQVLVWDGFDEIPATEYTG